MTGLLNARRERRVADAVIRDPEEHTVMDKDGAVRSIQAAHVTVPTEDLDRLWNKTSLERLARTYWRYLSKVTLGLIRVTYTEDERGGRAAVPPARAAALPRPRVRVRARPRGRALADRGRPARLPARARRPRLPGDRRPPHAAGGGGLVDRARRGRGRELLPGDRDVADEVRLLAHAVEDPRARHPWLPALARPARARGVGGRALRREQQRGVRHEKDGAITVGETPWGWIAAIAAAAVAACGAFATWLLCAANPSGSRSAPAASRGRGPR